MILRFLTVGVLTAAVNVCSCGTPLMVFAADRKASVSSAEETRAGAHDEAAARVGQKLARAAVPRPGLQGAIERTAAEFVATHPGYLVDDAGAIVKVAK